MSIKVYVDVRVDFDSQGHMIPLEITWEDGRKFQIDKIVNIRTAAALRAGGVGDRYTIMIHDRQSYLFFERLPASYLAAPGRWFVERRYA